MPLDLTQLKTPGVYIDEVPKFPPSIAAVATAIPAFIGYTEKAIDAKGNDLTNVPTRITSLLEYETFFGGAQPEENLEITWTEVTTPVGSETISVAYNGDASNHNMFYSLRAYFANGGGPCYVVSIGAYKTVGGALVLTEFEDGLAALEKEDEPTLIVFPEGQKMDEGDYYAIQNAALNQCGLLKDRFCIMDLHDTGETLATSGDVNTAATAFRGGITSSNIRYGAAYFPNLKAVFGYLADETSVIINHTVDAAAGAFDGNNLDALKSSNTAAYNKLLLALSRFPVILPPSPVMAGVYAQVDSARGVWKAPANVGLVSMTDVTFKVTNGIQDGLNVDPGTGKSINVIRPFTGKGILVWGARTLTGNDNEWRYVNVRRFFNMVEESSKKASEQFVFEPNDTNTWVKVQAMIENFLTTLWRQGALQGATTEQAFYVLVGLGKTMTADDILNGRMIVEIGMAVVRPAEFIVLRFSHKLPEA